MNAAFDSRPVAPAHHDPDVGPRHTIVVMVAVVLLFLVVAVGWSLWAELDVAVNSRGSVVAPSRIQEVQSLEGGIVQELLVRPGDPVTKGQLVARLDTAQVTADLGESHQQRLGVLAARARVEALLSGGAPQFDAAWRREVPELIEKETQLWRDALREYQANGRGAREAVQRRRGEITEAQARIELLQGAVRLGEESFAIEERLFKEGAGSRADYLSAQQRLMTQKTELDGLKQSLPRLMAGMAEAQATATEADAKSRSQWGTLRSEYETKVASLNSTLTGREDKVARREVYSPVDGVVNRVLVTTLGGIAQPGKAILEIVPNEADLLLNVRVRPADIGFIRTQQAAHVRVLAYDAATYGKMDAAVSRVGADAVLDEKGEPYFEVQLKAARDQLKLHDKPLSITPGMPVEVGILTGRRSVMQYMLKPVLRGVQGALQER